MKKRDVFPLYEASVQDAGEHLAFFRLIHAELSGDRPARILREDFCGTFLISRAWVRQGPEYHAYGLDIDPAPLAYGKKRAREELTREQQSRLHIQKKNAISATRPSADILAVCNFSFYVLHDRQTLVEYFKKARQSLRRKGGLMILEMAGGPGFIQTGTERKTFKLPNGKKCLYFWQQKSFDPISRLGEYRIHYQLEKGIRITDAFRYDWRIWSIPEVRDALHEAGFESTHVFWERADRSGNGTGEYVRSEKGDNAFAWIAYVVGRNH